MGDPIVTIAARTREQARAAAAAVKLHTNCTGDVDTARALKPGAYQIHNHAAGNLSPHNR